MPEASSQPCQALLKPSPSLSCQKKKKLSTRAEQALSRQTRPAPQRAARYTSQPPAKIFGVYCLTQLSQAKRAQSKKPKGAQAAGSLLQKNAQQQAFLSFPLSRTVYRFSYTRAKTATWLPTHKSPLQPHQPQSNDAESGRRSQSREPRLQPRFERLPHTSTRCARRA